MTITGMYRPCEWVTESAPLRRMEIAARTASCLDIAPPDGNPTEASGDARLPGAGPPNTPYRTTSNGSDARITLTALPSSPYDP